MPTAGHFLGIAIQVKYVAWCLIWSELPKKKKLVLLSFRSDFNCYFLVIDIVSPGHL